VPLAVNLLTVVGNRFLSVYNLDGPPELQVVASNPYSHAKGHFALHFPPSPAVCTLIRRIGPVTVSLGEQTQMRPQRRVEVTQMRREDVERLYDKHGPALVAYACAVLGRWTAAEDIVQQVFLKLLRRGSGIPTAVPLSAPQAVLNDPRAYLYRAVRNTALNARRAISREVELDPDANWFIAPAGAQADALTLQSALSELPEEQREIVVMRIWGGLTLEEAAAVLEISPNTAASRYRYGLEKLRQRLRPEKVREHAAGKR
jgi:RNA polymerase sigma-70 factor, ECF subfamily